MKLRYAALALFLLVRKSIKSLVRKRHFGYAACAVIFLIQAGLCTVQLDFLDRFHAEFAEYMPRLGDGPDTHPKADYFDTWTFGVPGFAQWVLVPLGVWFAFWRSKKQNKAVPILLSMVHGTLCLIAWYFCGVSFSYGMSVFD